jgi:hypothetical protein
LKIFDEVLQNDQRNIPALRGKARALFANHEIVAATGCYKIIISLKGSEIKEKYREKVKHGFIEFIAETIVTIFTGYTVDRSDYSS